MVDLITIRASRTIPADPAAVWQAISDIATHTRWMRDAHSVEFVTEQRRGKGTVAEVETRVGPLRTLDRIEVTGWIEGESIAVEHTGAVKGRGSFTVAQVGEGTLVELIEELSFPWWLGGRAGAWVAKPILGRIWRSNLMRLEGSISSL